MLKWALIFFLVSVVAGIFGFTGIPEDGERRTVDPLVVPTHQHFKHGGLPGEHLGNDRLIRKEAHAFKSRGAGQARSRSYHHIDFMYSTRSFISVAVSRKLNTRS